MSSSTSLLPSLILPSLLFASAQDGYGDLNPHSPFIKPGRATSFPLTLTNGHPTTGGHLSPELCVPNSNKCVFYTIITSSTPPPPAAPPPSRFSRSFPPLPPLSRDRTLRVEYTRGFQNPRHQS